MTSMPGGTKDLLTHLEGAQARLVATVTALDAASYAAPSLLPDWSRAHVVAHLTLNAEGLAAALRGAVAGEAVPMYPSPEARDSDIADLARRADLPDTLARLVHATADLLGAVADLTPEAATTTIARTPGSDRTFPAASVALMRWREVEIHHADLGAAYSPADWSSEFAAALVDSLAPRADELGISLHADDLGRSWQAGGGGPTVSGSAADLGWWLTGRGSGSALTSDDGSVPRMEAW